MKHFFVFISILAMLLTVGCGKADETLSNINEESESDEHQGGNVLKYTAPLTGLPIEEENNNRIIGVMINNHSKARPQSGLAQADMVYEVLAEGMITRFVAIYQSQEPEKIGPVRSIRPYYLDIINGFDALIAHSGGSPEAYETIFNSDLPDLDEIRRAGEAYWREDFREPPHNLYTSAERIKEAANDRDFNTEGYIPEFIFLDEMDIKEGFTAKEVTINYYTDYVVSYKYDETTKLYNRGINGQPHIDYDTKEQLTAKNLLIIEAHHKILDSAGRREIDVYGPGNGYLFQNGVGREVIWERKDGVIRAYINGEEQGLYPGQTWTIIVPEKSDVLYK